MNRNTRSVGTLIFLILLVSTPSPTRSISILQWRTVFSLAHSLLTRVANLRASRGDSAGSERARLLADKLERGLGLGFWKVAWSMGSNYLRNYAWRDVASTDLFGTVNDINALLRFLNELTQLDSDVDRAAWLQRNYRAVLRVSNSLVRRSLNTFRQSGPLREMVEREVVEGGLLRDCLELGSSDLRGLIQVLKDLASQMSADERDL
ncbi:uncharacterized protein LOC131144093 [Malania oleifera]|uniref:uncharacterized protein LOC131144093 n=1 Tax=Malania oleifera TaxID=397392 RepID=UPI0025AE27D7|nr:uncharacterized protein LOC131144093 [Malania oleifera]